MYVISGGGYGGAANLDGISNGCATTGNAKTIPTEVLEQYYPVLVEHYQLHERSSGPGRHRGGMGVNYKFQLRAGDAKLSFIGDHARFGPPGAGGGHPGGVERVVVRRADGGEYHPPHLSKDNGIPMKAGDSVEVWTPGGGGYGNPFDRNPAAVADDVRMGYFTPDDAERAYGVVLDPETFAVDETATRDARERQPGS
jgi:N-methylhydantoinase B